MQALLVSNSLDKLVTKVLIVNEVIFLVLHMITRQIRIYKTYMVKNMLNLTKIK